MVYKWHIFLANLDPVIGSEQGKTRPVIIISEEKLNNILPVVNILPITTRKFNRKIYPDSVILCYQIRTIDKRRLIFDIGEIKDYNLQENIIDALFFQLGIIR